MQPTIWCLLPPALTILVALLTRQVYFSLIFGIIVGVGLTVGWDPGLTVKTMFSLLGEKVGGNIDIILFLVLAGALISLLLHSGASLAYGEWAGRRIHTKRGASLLAVLLGLAVFVDDYTSCLVTGAAMRPAIDRFGVSRAKFAYIIDSTAGPVAVISPVATWAVAIMSNLPDKAPHSTYAQFLATIPFNYYALGSIFFVVFIVWLNRDFFAMKAVAAAEEGRARRQAEGMQAAAARGSALDLIVPLLVLVGMTIYTMLSTGGYFDGKGLVEAFGGCDSSKCLTYGGFAAIVACVIMYMPRRLLSFTDLCNCVEEGLKSMAPAIIILSLAWTLSLVCGPKYLNIGQYVGSILSGYHGIQTMLPFAFFLSSLLLAFATGTSWGTFAILLPIATTVISAASPASPDWAFITICHSAVLSGAVAGDHVSPISDTTILSSTGAGCPHLDHVSTQLPYAMFPGLAACGGFLVAGVTANGWMGLAAAAAVLGLSAAVLAVRK